MRLSKSRLLAMPALSPLLYAFHREFLSPAFVNLYDLGNSSVQPRPEIVGLRPPDNLVVGRVWRKGRDGA